MTKVQPKKNTLDMDFLNSMDKTVSKKEEDTISKTEIETVINPVNMNLTEPAVDNSSKLESNKKAEYTGELKETQITIRVTETEKDIIKTYFTKHGVSISQGIKLAIKYLEHQEKKGLVEFSDVGLF